MVPRCTLCDAEDASEYFRVGPRCASILGLRMLPPSRRPPAPCMRCNNFKFIRVMPRQYGTMWRDAGPQAHELHSMGVPMTLTARPPEVRKRLLGADTVEEPQLFDGLGIVETYVCTRCGFIEWYCQDPEAMPIGDEHNTQLVDYTPDDPYR
jgi:hypothetical protein